VNGRLALFALAGLLFSIALAALVSPLASSWPDGLERVAEDKGFLKKGEGEPVWPFAILPDYRVPGSGSEWAGVALAGFAGTLLVFGAVFCTARLLARKPRSDEGMR
jgi:cobalt/nickel transport protein